MGRHPHLGPFQLEGPHDLAVARDAMAATGTADLADRPYMTLSGGEKQRVVIASALAQSPDVLLLDEPTASLDLGYQLEVASLLSRLNRDRAVTMVLATHDLNLAAGLCDTLVLLRAGRVLAAGTDARGPDRADDRAAVRRGRRRAVPRGRGTPDGHPDAALAMSTIEYAIAARRPIRARLALTLAGFGTFAAGDVRAGAARGQHPHQPGACVRPLDSVRGQRRRADLLRGAHAARARRCLRRRHAGRRRCRAAGDAAQPAGHAIHAGRFRRGLARRDAGDRVRRVDRRRAALTRAAGEPGGSRGGVGHRLPPGDDAGPGDVNLGAAAGRGHAEFVLLGADHVRAVHRRFRAGLSCHAVADGRSRRGQLRAHRRGAAADARRIRAVRAASLLAQPAQRRRGCRCHARRGRGACAPARVPERRRWPPRRLSRWPVRSASSASWCPTSCG